MAVVFTLTSTGLTTITLTTGTDFTLRDDEYVPVVATPTGDGSIPPYVTETLPVILSGATHNAMALSMQELAALAKRAAEYWVDPQQPTPVWLNHKLHAETAGTQALVKAIHFEFTPDIEGIYRDCAGAQHYLVGTILVERHPYPERTAARTFPNTTPAAAASVAYDYTTTADLVGDVPARINGLAVRRSATGNLTRLWMGVRSTTKWGTDAVTAFRPVWECEDGAGLDAEAAVDAVTEPGLSSPGGAAGEFVRVTPVGGGTDWDDGSFHDVFYLNPQLVGYIPGDIEGSFGRFLWLLRAKVSSGTWEVRCYYGYLYALASTDPVEISSTTNWDYHEVGVFGFPPRSLQAIDATAAPYTVESSARIWVYARRTSGTGNLLLDCLCPVPTDEGFLKIHDCRATEAIDVIVGQGPKDITQVATLAATGQDLSVFEEETFRLPPGDGRLIIVYARATAASVFTDAIELADPTTLTSTYTERWTSLRGAE